MRSDTGDKKRNQGVSKRLLPVFTIPLLVGLCELNAGIAGTTYTVLGLLLGIAISALVPPGWPALFSSLAVSVMLLSTSYVQELERHVANQETQQTAAKQETQQAADTFQHQSAGRHLRHGGMGRPIPHEPPSHVHNLETMSVVLPCAFEGSFAEQTVDAIVANTNASRLREILVVDDGSNPPLSTKWPTRFTRSSQPLIKVIRHETTEGLISAKKTGGDAATSDIIVFFDCHVSPRAGWEEAFVKQMKRAGDHKTVVVPTITSLDPDTWKELPNGPASKACFVLLNADFTWLADSGRDVPLMSGGLLALSRKWWRESGGYDEHMVAWGGENIDQSLRAWLCGGRIEAAEGAYVAHMWRDPSKPKTMLRYPIPTRDVMRNKARAVTAWMDKFRDKVFTFPEYEAFSDGSETLGDMSNFRSLKSQLTCAPFSSYINRFSYVYLDGGLIPAEIFQIKEEQTGLCLERVQLGRPPHGTALAPCVGDDDGNPGSISELQLWHGANRDHSQPNSPCCSGIMNWNFFTCLDAQGVGSRVKTFECQINGHSLNQAFELSDKGDFLYRRGSHETQQSRGGCVAPDTPTSGEAVFKHDLASVTTMVTEVTERDIEDSKPLVADEYKDNLGNRVPRKFRLRSETLSAHGSCAVAMGDSNGGAGWKLSFQSCDTKNRLQIFTLKPMHGGFQVIAVETGNSMCLDSAGGTQILIYPCYPENVRNMNQIWHVNQGHLMWKPDAVVDFEVHHSLTDSRDKFRMEPCTGKQGQRIRKYSIQADGSFKLRDEDTGQCIGFPTASEGSHYIGFGHCEDEQFSFMEGPVHTFQVAQRDSRGQQRCLDANDYKTPLIVPCQPGKVTQRWKADDRGFIKVIHAWEDNGRRRFFEKCLDTSPQEHLVVSVQPCDVARERGVKWTRVNVRVPPETVTWNEAPKPGPDDPILGGDAEPPK